MILTVIKCGNCRESHRDADEVRRCSGLSTPNKPIELKPQERPKGYFCGNPSHNHTSRESALKCATRGGRPSSVNETVYVTNRGGRFHNNSTCSALNKNLFHTLHRVLWIDIKHDHYTPCKKCVS